MSNFNLLINIYTLPGEKRSRLASTRALLDPVAMR